MQTQKESVRTRSLIFQWWSEVIEGHIAAAAGRHLQRLAPCKHGEGCAGRDLSPNTWIMFVHGLIV